jgi:2-polyprenyl-3-methyl-5-hydroxy-6-metoxy-1,4-benzoquinol methylase
MRLAHIAVVLARLRSPRAMTRQPSISWRRELRRRRRSRDVWEFLGTIDADWAVLTESARRNHGWDPAIDEFYASGVKVVAEMTASIPRPSSQRRALDWGTGPGRLAFAMAALYEEVVAVDIADSMLETAAERIRNRGINNVRLENVREYEPKGDCDLVISQLVLQHCTSESEVIETLSVLAASLAPDGWLVVEIPSRSQDLRGRLQIKVRLYRLLRGAGASLPRLREWGLSGISTLTIRADLVMAALQSAGLEPRSWVDRMTGFEYVRYAAHLPADSTPQSFAAAAEATSGAAADTYEAPSAGPRSRKVKGWPSQ